MPCLEGNSSWLHDSLRPIVSCCMMTVDTQSQRPVQEAQKRIPNFLASQRVNMDACVERRAHRNKTPIEESAAHLTFVRLLLDAFQTDMEYL
jgi:pyruvate/2-oxoglutarate dehydrogenase complex dihydrolipoamide acyltransferase (E2) component